MGLYLFDRCDLGLLAATVGHAAQAPDLLFGEDEGAVFG